MICNVCNSEKLFEGTFVTGHGLEFFAPIPKRSWLYADAYTSKLSAIACKDCGNIVQVKLQNLEGLKKLEDPQ